MKNLQGNLKTLKKNGFQNAKPYPHISIDEFLHNDFACQIERNFPNPQDDDYDNWCVGDDGKIGRNYADCKLDSWHDTFKKLHSFLSSSDFIGYLETETGISDLVYDTTYQGGGIRISAGDSFLPIHLDFNRHPAKPELHRRLNLLIYFNKNWSDGYGGHIQVHKNPQIVGANKSLVGEYAPIFNRAFLFETSEVSWHGFRRLALPMDKNRKLFSVYYYTRERPEGDVPFRNTEYVEPWLPEELNVSDADRAVIEELLKRRDCRIAMLYKIRREFDAKYAFLWSEYEYYLNAFRDAEQKLSK